MSSEHTAWRRSSYSASGSNCVEIATWRKSSRSGHQGQCVEVGAAPGVTGVRDSKLGARSPILAFDAARFAGFLGAIKHGRFDG